MAERPSVSIRLGGSTYHVQSSASPDEVQRLADVVDERLRALTPGDRPASPQSFLLVALAFAHDLSDERGRREAAESELADLRRRLAPAPPRPWSSRPALAPPAGGAAGEAPRRRRGGSPHRALRLLVAPTTAPPTPRRAGSVGRHLGLCAVAANPLR